MPFDSNSTYRLYNSKTSMFPSPRSSLSSFRDYYQHSSENSAWENKLEDSIDIGFRNFQVSKLLEKIDLRMHHKLYWNLFYSFKRIAIQNIHDERTMAARQKLKEIIAKRNNSNFKFMGKNRFLSQLLWNVQFERQRQLQLLLKVVLWLSAKYRKTMSQCYYKICRFRVRQKPEMSKLNQRYTKKLSKALLCIVFRNLLNRKIKQVFELIKHQQSQENNTSSIMFFKPKKGKQVYEHRVDEKISKLSNFMFLFKTIAKQTTHRLRTSFLNIRKFGKSTTGQRQADSLQVMSNVVKHLVYLTAKENSALDKQSQATNKIKAIKLYSLAKRLQRRHKWKVRQCVFHWRQIAGQHKRELRAEIERLMDLKQQILQDI